MECDQNSPEKLTPESVADDLEDLAVKADTKGQAKGAKKRPTDKKTYGIHINSFLNVLY